MRTRIKQAKIFYCRMVILSNLNNIIINYVFFRRVQSSVSFPTNLLNGSTDFNFSAIPEPVGLSNQPLILDVLQFERITASGENSNSKLPLCPDIPDIKDLRKLFIDNFPTPFFRRTSWPSHSLNRRPIRGRSLSFILVRQTGRSLETNALSGKAQGCCYNSLSRSPIPFNTPARLPSANDEETITRLPFYRYRTSIESFYWPITQPFS